MTDQADRLREIVRETSRRVDTAPAPPALVVSAGRAGVGGSTVAVNLTIALAQRGARVVLLDADLKGTGATRLAADETPAEKSICDVLAGRITTGEALQPGPEGSALLGGNRNDPLPRLTDSAPTRLLAELGQQHQPIDLVIVDAGPGLSPWTHAWWDAARHVAVVTTPDDPAVMDAYALVKLACRGGRTPAVSLIVNRCDSQRLADQVHGRVAQACFHFLEQFVPSLGRLPTCALEAPVLLPRVGQRQPEFARDAQQLAGQVADELGLRAAGPARRVTGEEWGSKKEKTIQLARPW